MDSTVKRKIAISLVLLLGWISLPFWRVGCAIYKVPLALSLHLYSVSTIEVDPLTRWCLLFQFLPSIPGQ